MSVRACQHQSAQAYIDLWEHIEKLLPLQQLKEKQHQLKVEKHPQKKL
mgnify:CR=1 FL=1